jgi:hypothetical protein
LDEVGQQGVTVLYEVISKIFHTGAALYAAGSFLDPSELLEIQIEWSVYHIMCGYVACVLEYRGSNGMICISGNSDGSKKLPDDGRLLPKHVGASI